jgi:ribose transport system substrate-binding protein
MERSPGNRAVWGVIGLALVCLAFAFVWKQVTTPSTPPALVPANVLLHILQPAPGTTEQPIAIRGPKGEPPATISDLLALLGPESCAELRNTAPTAVVCMQGLQDLRNDWSRLQVAGIRDTFARLGIQLLAVTDGEFEIGKQVADYRQAIALRPDVMLTIPLDSARCAPVLREAAASGIRLVFMDSVPDGMAYPADYSCLVMADSRANGRIAAELIVDRVSAHGKVALLHWQNRIFTCDQRSASARETFARHPGIRIVAEPTFAGVYEVKSIVRKLLTDHPDLAGLWVVWDTPAFEALDMIRELQAPTIVASVDLSVPGALALAEDPNFAGVGAQHPYHQGVAEALAAAVVLSGGTPPPFVVVPGHRVTRENLPSAWEHVLMQAPSPHPMTYRRGPP